ncbi:MAG: serine/threonine-protein kinase, partial [Bacteroidetes bacterium]|nr:serine/threonine-protein kinase [Bacteroidota bacterium]
MVHARDRFRRRPALQAAFFVVENLQAVKLRLSPLSPIYWVQPIIFLLSRTRMTGEIIAQYEILEEIGRGGMGVVYKARDTKLDRFVALKFLPPYLTQDTTARERFIGEAKAAAAIEHNHICTIHDIAESEDGRTYIVMSYYSGVALNERIGDGPVPSEEAIRIGQQTASALAAAHSAGITHRDIKPGNLILTDDGDVKMVDFGLAKLAGQVDLTKSRSTVGTAAYMSPEQVRGQSVDYRTDLWSLGVVIYEMVTGQRPFQGEYEQALSYAILNV